ncbi:MAG: prolipoprotein diacylglyceryl transferase [Clostridia bacterium]|nr:prolipoprotein diacylglyceryl transferase [Clostridia bacterium]
MYPDKIFLGMTLYDIFFAVGILAALMIFRVLSDKRGTDAKLFNFSLFTGVGAIFFGVLSAVLFQAIYNYGDTGVFVINKNTGMTFYGGLIGGVAVFLAIYFGVGKFVFGDKRHLTNFFSISDAAACSIAVAHATGRVGCLFAGCCHGIHAEPPLGIYMQFAGDTVLPTQLYEAVFLYALLAFLVWRYLTHRAYNLPIYMVAYGVWRFFIEYMRGDERGATFIKLLSPSQLTAILLVIGGAALFYIEYRIYRRFEVTNE